MAGKRAKEAPLVADRRYGAAPEPRSGGSPPPRRPRKKSRGGGGGGRRRFTILGFFGAIFGMIWRLVWGIGIRVAVLVGLVLLAASAYYYSTLPPIEKLIDARARGSVTLMDRDGKVFAWRGETFGLITADTASPNLVNAIIATEDKHYYRHFAVSPRGILSAIAINMREGRGPFQGNGGSTITQQLAKLLCLGVPFDPATWKSESAYEDDCRSGGLKRKLKEIPYAFALEAKYGKKDVLTLYLNRAYLGAGARGFEAASQRYFGKSAADVSPAEAAMLAGLLKAPSQFAPTNNLERAQNRAGVVLGLMHEQRYITDAQYQEALANPARLSQAAAQKDGGYFADWLMDSAPDFLTKNTTEDVVIDTTLDPALQKKAEDGVNAVFSTKLKDGSKVEAAVVVMSADGAVRAMVGGRETAAPGAFNRATQAKRQPGSTFKPFVYAAALDLGDTENSLVDDAPVCIFVKGSGDWCPKNYEPGFSGVMTYTDALARSINTATVRVSQRAGLDAVRTVATDFGFASDLAAGPALALGVSESTLLEMTGAYAGILNGGSSVTPYGITDLKIRGDDTSLMGQSGGMGERVISESAARQLTYMMNQVIERGTGRRARLDGWQAAGKTGTTQSARDAWFIGFTADYVVGVWMGYDDNSPLTGTTGGGLPAQIWHEVMARIHDGQKPLPLTMIAPDQLPPPQPIAADGTVAPYTDAAGVPVGEAPAGQAPAEPVPQGGKSIGDILMGILGGN